MKKIYFKYISISLFFCLLFTCFEISFDSEKYFNSLYLSRLFHLFIQIKIGFLLGNSIKFEKKKIELQKAILNEKKRHANEIKRLKAIQKEIALMNKNIFEKIKELNTLNYLNNENVKLLNDLQTVLKRISENS